jgi:hypothetical protein
LTATRAAAVTAWPSLRCNGNGANCPPTNLINGGANTQLVGGIYVPTGQPTYSGNSSNTLVCSVVVAHTVTFTGNSDMARDCDSLGVPVQRLRVVRLVE